MSKDSINIKNIKGAVISGIDIDGTGNIVGKEVTVIQLVNPTAEEIVQLKKQVNDLESGELRIPRADLLLKKAILLQSDSGQEILDWIDRVSKARRRGDLEIITTSDGNWTFKKKGDAAKVNWPEAFRKAAAVQEVKIKEAYSLLQEANELDPFNTEVLLRMAFLLHTKDPSAARKIVLRVLALLGQPKNDVEKSQLGQMKFLLAKTISPSNESLRYLREARGIFEELRNRNWILICDKALAEVERAAGSRRDASPDDELDRIDREWEGAQRMEPEESQRRQEAGFQPVGRWKIEGATLGIIGWKMFVDLTPDGTLQGSQQSFGMNIPFSGIWTFDPSNKVLYLQPLGLDPVHIIIQGRQNNGYYGTDASGINRFSLTPR